MIKCCTEIDIEEVAPVIIKIDQCKIDNSMILLLKAENEYLRFHVKTIETLNKQLLSQLTKIIHVLNLIIYIAYQYLIVLKMS